MSDRIRVYCHTNLDDYKNERWPEVFVVPPHVGDSVTSESGKTLRIVQITHGYVRVTTADPIWLEIELHK